MLNRRENVIVEKSERFADRIVKMHKYLAKKREGNSDILKQVVRDRQDADAVRHDDVECQIYLIVLNLYSDSVF